MPLKLNVNGRKHDVESSPDRMLLYVLREDLDLTGTKYGCGEGQCGACTVLVENSVVRSCMTPVGSVTGKAITTIEGLEKSGELHPVQKAFLDADAFQCGYCTSGMIMSAVALLEKHASPDHSEIVAAMDGNICRCGTYSRIIKAVQLASKELKRDRQSRS
jgi:aerobic-type carbon monoxide dehydrogenase small subunit (CoxS/CutS family)